MVASVDDIDPDAVTVETLVYHDDKFTAMFIPATCVTLTEASATASHPAL